MEKSRFRNVPNKPSWLLRLNDILADLPRPELTSLPFLSRAAVKKGFGLKGRQPTQNMHAVGGFQIGKAFAVARYYARATSTLSPRSGTSAKPADITPL